MLNTSSGRGVLGRQFVDIHCERSEAILQGFRRGLEAGVNVSESACGCR